MKSREKDIHNCEALQQRNGQALYIVEVDGYFGQYTLYVEDCDTGENVLLDVRYCPFCGEKLDNVTIGQTD